MDTLDTATPAPGGTRRRFLRDAGAALATLLPVGRVLGQDRSSFPPSDVRHYGIVPNVAGAATANTAALKALVNPAGSFSGPLLFPNTTGADVYHFNDLIAFHDGVHLDLGGSTLSFSKSGVKADSASGFIHAIRDFVIENGAVVTSYVFNGGYNAGNVLAFGGRGNDTALFPNLYDRMLPAPMGNITVRNLRLAGGATGGGARGIFMLGGFDGVTIENVSIDGQKGLTEGIYYEFGWATNEPLERERHSSHARDLRISHLTVANVTNWAVGANGAYDIVIDGLHASNTGQVCAIGTGEALYFRPWIPRGALNRRPSFSARNVVGESIRVLGISVTGASSLSGSYLDNPPAHDNPHRISADQQSDLIDFVLDHFTLSGSSKNYGVLTSAASAQILNGTLTSFQRGIVTTQECTQFLIDSVKIFDSASFGIQIGQGNSLHNPPRRAGGIVRNCVIAGSGATGGAAGLIVATTRSCLIEGNRFGYDPSVDGKSEQTQTQAVNVTADASGVDCRNNYVAGTAGGAVAYVLSGSPGRNCRIDSPRGTQTKSGPWGS
jgi:hypothetical protein